jgi:hypothetical protein
MKEICTVNQFLVSPLFSNEKIIYIYMYVNQVFCLLFHIVVRICLLSLKKNINYKCLNTQS